MRPAGRAPVPMGSIREETPSLSRSPFTEYKRDAKMLVLMRLLPSPVQLLAVCSGLLFIKRRQILFGLGQVM